MVEALVVGRGRIASTRSNVQQRVWDSGTRGQGNVAIHRKREGGRAVTPAPASDRKYQHPHTHQHGTRGTGGGGARGAQAEGSHWGGGKRGKEGKRGNCGERREKEESVELQGRFDRHDRTR